MADLDLVDRLAALPSLAGCPRPELEWLVAHGRLEVHPKGTSFARKGVPIDWLWILLSGHVAIWVDRGAGPRRVMEWRTGDVSGMLPFSRMTAPPGDSCVEKTAEVLSIHRDHFAEMIHRCPVFTAHTVHTMLDRARNFNTSDQQDEKMISLGKLAAGLAHELNNPAAATVRGAKVLVTSLAEADAAARALGAAGLSAELTATIEQVRAACLAQPTGTILSPIQQSDREDEIAAWLERRGANPAHAPALAETVVTIEMLEQLARAASGPTLDAALRWIAAGCAVRSLALTIDHAATRISELVNAVKQFTHMDRLAGPEDADVEIGLRDTIRILESKTRSKGAAITLDVDAGLPRVRATGGELNQVWMNLIDNALDAIADAGHIDISARLEVGRVVVRIVDDGPGIPPEVMPRIFDPFFTTKPPGQGTDLGLDITRRILGRYHGEISVQSRPGRTEFRVGLVTETPSPANDGAVAGDR